MDDHQAVVGQLGRTMRSAVEVVARCHLGLPVVVAVPPLLDDGTPFPTRYWLTCPLARRRIGRLEAAGGVAAAQRRIDTDPAYAAGYHRSMERYAAARDRLVDPDHRGPVPGGGVGGSGGGVKCLHAHYADHAAGNDNPVGAGVAPDVEPLPCAVACVTIIDGHPGRNPDWSEPPR
ncbi:MAG: DUF501 domain-containing protein [Actinomycetota bacterium]|nr:DUF501 domain-containing protein [Actinomycetota bacterium]